MTKTKKIIILIVSITAALAIIVRLFYVNMNFEPYQEKYVPMNQTALLSDQGSMQITSAFFTKNKVPHLSAAETAMLVGERQQDKVFLVVQARSNYHGPITNLNLNVNNQNIYQLTLPGTKRLSQKNHWQFVFKLPEKYNHSTTKLQLSLDNPKITHHTRNVFLVEAKAVN